MGNFFRMINARWGREEMTSWGSLRKTAYLLLPLLFYFVVHDAAEVLLWAGLNGLMTKGSASLTEFLAGNAYTVNGLINGLSILAGVAAIWQAVYGEISGGETKASPAAKSSERVVTGYIAIGVLAFLSALALNLIFSLSGLTGSSESFGQTARAQYGVNFAIGLLLYGILSPAAEEAVFRGLIYNRMKRCFGYFIALPVSSLFFGCYHGNWVQALYGTLLGLLIAWTYEQYGSFAAPVLFHSVSNVSIYAMTYYNSLGNLSRSVSVGVAAVSLAGAAVCFWYIKKRVCPAKNQ